MTETDVPSTSDDVDDEPVGPVGPLDGDAARRVAGAQVAIVSTSDTHGDTDVSVLAGVRCFVRVLDAHRLAYPDEGVEPMTASRSNLAESPGIAMLLVEPGEETGGGGRRALHLNGTARVVPAEELRTEYADLPTDPVPGQSTDVWVVVEVGDAYALDGAEVPPIGGGASAGGGRGPRGPRGAAAGTPAGGDRRRRSPLVLVLGILVVALVVALVGTVAVLTNKASTEAAGSDAPAATPASPAPAASSGLPPGPPTLFGRVTQVVSPTRVVVDVGGSPVTVDVLGLDPAGVPPCAATGAVAFARTTLQDQEVTLVPDPTIPAQPTPPGFTRAYAVLETQQSYTDAALNAGWGRAGGPSRYLDGYRTEQSAAESGSKGQFGAICG